MSEELDVLKLVTARLDATGIPYMVTGSMAMNYYAVPRMTRDIDIVVDLSAGHAARVVDAFGGDFYVDADMIRDAIARRASFNVIHLATMFKADVFIMKPDAWSREEMSRARQEQLDGPDGAVAIRFASPEDTLLHKLVWYRLGNEMSDRQWSDILGVLKIQGERLDVEYLERWAPLLGVADLLVRARSQP